MSASIQRMLVIGLGLIGGSLARSLKQSGYCAHVVGHGYRDVSLKKGVDLGVIDSYSLDLDEALDGVDMVIIGTPTLVANRVLKDLLPRVDESLVITDVASVKGSLVEAAREATGDGTVPPNFVPGHPIAGSERSGVDSSRADLFVDHRVILTPVEETAPAALEAVRAMWAETGADVVDMPVSDHDAILAATSHLPHVLAYALVDALANSELSEDIFRFAAGGFRDFTRIASSDPVMWRDISLANRQELLNSMDVFSEYLAKLRRAVDEGDADALHATFSAAKAARDEFLVGGKK